jgi:hypothetical protein
MSTTPTATSPFPLFGTDNQDPARARLVTA